MNKRQYQNKKNYNSDKCRIVEFATIILFWAILLLFSHSYLSASETKLYIEGNAKICEKKNNVVLNELMVDAMSSPLDICTLTSMCDGDLRLLRNSIFAKYGYIFKSPELSAYFKQLPWYKEDKSFSPSKLTSIQKNNVETIRLMEILLTKTKDDNSTLERDYESIDHHSFQKITDFLLPITSLPRQHEDVEVKNKKLIFKKTDKVVDLHVDKSNKRYEVGEIPSSPNWRVTEKGILVMWPHSYPGVDMKGCRSEYYSFTGDLLFRISSCPDYVFKKNPNVFVEAHYSGCCGAYAWDLGIFNFLSRQERTFPCPDSECQDVLLTYLPQSNELLIASLNGSYQAGTWSYQKSGFWLFNKDGAETAHFETIYINTLSDWAGTPFLIANLVGTIKLPGKNEWLFKFVDNEEVYFVLLSKEISFGPSKGAIFIDAYGGRSKIKAKVYINDIYKGQTPYIEFIIPGKYRLTLSAPGYQNYERVMEIQKGDIFQIWPYLQKPTK